jgi:hypothetical protein
MLFISMTVDPKRYSRHEAWLQISNELHLFETKLRQYYGNFVKFRVWESHKSGYPHCHSVYYFIDKWFKVFLHNSKYRITTTHKNRISDMWSMGNTDIQGVQDTHGAFSEVKKYITKNIWNQKGDLTNALVSLYNKQMYSLSRCDPFKKRLHHWRKHGITDWRKQELCFMSNLHKWAKKDFIGAIWGTQIYFQFYRSNCGGLAEPNPTALVNEYLHNCNISDVKLKFIGCVSGRDLAEFVPNSDEDWLIIADPPPEAKFILGLGHDELRISRG